MLASWKESYDKSRQCIKNLTKVHLVKAIVFPLVMYRCESWTTKETWVPKNSCFQTVVLEKTLESPLDCKEIKSVSLKGNQPWIFIGRTDAEAEAPILWTDVKSQLTGKDPDAGKDWGKEEESVTEDKMMVSLTQWTWVWANSRRQWKTGRPGMLQSMGSERVGHDWVTEHWVLHPWSWTW